MGSTSTNGRLIVSVHLCTHEQRSSLLMCCHMNYEPKKKRGKKVRRMSGCTHLDNFTEQYKRTCVILFIPIVHARSNACCCCSRTVPRKKKRDYSFQYSTRILTGAGRLIVHWMTYDWKWLYMTFPMNENTK